jgi:hypothetical protein
MTQTIPEALNKLVAQGSPDQIALFLEQQGIQAIPSCSDRCAIADYVVATTGITVGVTPSLTTTAIDENGERVPHTLVGWVRARTGGFPLPEVLSDLAKKFDRREYPNLIG